MSHEVQQVELRVTCRGDKISPKLVLHSYKSISSHEGTCRCKISLGHVPATFSCVCKCCDFVPATCPRYTSLLPVASVCTTQVFVAAACRCDMSLQHDPSCLPTFKTIALLCKEEISIQEKQVDLKNSMVILKACLCPSVFILRCRGPKKVG